MLKRNCPECNCDIEYKTKVGYEKGIRKGTLCRKCTFSGERNGFYGKTHTDETKVKIKCRDFSNYKTDEFKTKMSLLTSGVNNGMHGKSNYAIWVKKYGKEIAEQKMIEFKNKISEANKGENNPMYSKPSPTGSGNGWSGWYKGWYFRSLRELTYMVKVIERFNLKWVSGESNQYKIEYIDYKGSNRNYFPDFIINDKYIIECKPKKLWNSDNVSRKTEAALKFCEINGLVYKKRDIGILSELEIKKLHDNGDIKFLDRYEIKYKEKFD